MPGSNSLQLLLAFGLYFFTQITLAEDVQPPAVVSGSASDRIPFKPERSVETQSSLGKAIGVIFVISLLGGGVALYRRNKLGFLLKNNITTDEKIVILSRKALSPSTSLLLVKVDDKTYFIGQSASGFTLLDSFSPDSSRVTGL